MGASLKGSYAYANQKCWIWASKVAGDQVLRGACASKVTNLRTFWDLLGLNHFAVMPEKKTTSKHGLAVSSTCHLFRVHGAKDLSSLVLLVLQMTYPAAPGYRRRFGAKTNPEPPQTNFPAVQAELDFSTKKHEHPSLLPLVVQLQCGKEPGPPPTAAWGRCNAGFKVLIWHVRALLLYLGYRFKLVSSLAMPTIVLTETLIFCTTFLTVCHFTLSRCIRGLSGSASKFLAAESAA